MPFKLPWQKTEDGNLEVSLPDDLKTKLDNSASKEDLGKLNDTLAKLQESINSINVNAAAEAEERKKAATRRAAEEARARNEQTDEELNELALTDPVAATKRIVEQSTAAQTQALLLVNAQNVRREVFEDTEKYPFYTGELKAEVDRIIGAESPQAQNNRGLIEHAYNSVVGKHYKEIMEGKLKTRFASSEGNRGTSTGNTGSKEDQGPRRLSDDEKKVARVLGFKEDEYGKMLDEEGVGSV